MKQKLIAFKEEINDSMTIVGNFNILFSTPDGTRQKINKEIEHLNNTIKQAVLINIYPTLSKTEYQNTDRPCHTP